MGKLATAIAFGAAVLLGACTSAETERPAPVPIPAPPPERGIYLGDDVIHISLIRPETATVPCPADYAPYTLCVIHPSGVAVRAQVATPRQLAEIDNGCTLPDAKTNPRCAPPTGDPTPVECPAGYPEWARCEERPDGTPIQTGSPVTGVMQEDHGKCLPPSDTGITACADDNGTMRYIPPT